MDTGRTRFDSKRKLKNEQAANVLSIQLTVRYSLYVSPDYGQNFNKGVNENVSSDVDAKLRPSPPF